MRKTGGNRTPHTPPLYGVPPSVFESELLCEFRDSIGGNDVLQAVDNVVDVHDFGRFKQELHDGFDAHRKGSFGFGIVADLQARLQGLVNSSKVDCGLPHIEPHKQRMRQVCKPRTRCLLKGKVTKQAIDEGTHNFASLGFVVGVEFHAEGEALVDVHKGIASCGGEALVGYG